MSTTTASVEIPDRDRRALEQYLTVIQAAPDMYDVVSQSGRSHTVDLREEHCTCEDHQYRGGACKHIRRVEFATGERAIPAAWAATLDIDPELGEHVDGTVRVEVQA